MISGVEEEELDGCPVHFYRDSKSIFAEALAANRGAAFTTQKNPRGQVGLQGMPDQRQVHPVHTYEAQYSSLNVSPPGMPSHWRKVGQPRRRAPRPLIKPAVPGSKLERKRESVPQSKRGMRAMSQSVEAAVHRAHVAAVSPTRQRATLICGGSMDETSSRFYITTSASHPRLSPYQRYKTPPDLSRTLAKSESSPSLGLPSLPSLS